MNLLLSTDVYKVGHMEQYPEGTSKVYSYLCARKDFGSVHIDKVVFFGLQYYLKKYLTQGVSHEDVEEFIDVYRNIVPLPQTTIDRLKALADLGYLPLKIKALPEMKAYPLQTPLMTITNTHPDFYWLVNYIEGLMLKLWYPCSVATRSKQYYGLAKQYAVDTCDSNDHLPYCVHDFGYRSVSSEESAALGAAAHLLKFSGSDTILGEHLLRNYYGVAKAQSVPASEHSVMCSLGKEREFEAFERMLDIYPTGIVSIVSDTYDLWNVLTNFVDKLKGRILERDGKVVFRPDSGSPFHIINGDPHSDSEAARKGALRLLWDSFGGTINRKGYRVLNPKVGLIYGDGMFYERYLEILEGMKNQGFASSNLVIGVGGLLLQNHSRDDFGFAQKTTYIEVNGRPRNVYKDPITDRKKKSHKGLLMVELGEEVKVFEECTPGLEEQGDLMTVFEDGEIKYFEN